MKHIEPWFDAKGSPDLAHSEAILATFWREAQWAIEGLDDFFPDGHFEAEHGASRVQSYKNRDALLACMRVVRYTRDKTTRMHITECLLAKPATRPAVVALRAWCVQPSGGRISSGVDIPTIWEELTRDHRISAAADDKFVPYFDQVLALVRESEGQALVLESEGPSTSEELNELMVERDYYKQLVLNQAERLKGLGTKLRAAQDALKQKDNPLDLDVESLVLEPRDLEHLPMWGAEHEDRLVLLPRALAGAKRSLYQDDEEIFKALEFLAGPYWMHRSGILPLEEYQARLAEAGLRLAGSAGQTTATTHSQDYFARYKGQKRFLDWHVVKGGGRDQRFCMRIYFFWDAEDKKVVVGWLPSHLDNSLT